MGNIVPETSPLEASSRSGLLAFDAKVSGFDKPLRLLVDSGASENFASRATLSRNSELYTRARRTSRQIAVRLATGVTVKAQESLIDLRVKFSDFSCVEEFHVLDMDARYDLILGIKWLARHQPWIDWRTRTIASSSPISNEIPREWSAIDAAERTDQLEIEQLSVEKNPSPEERMGSTEDREDARVERDLPKGIDQEDPSRHETMGSTDDRDAARVERSPPVGVEENTREELITPSRRDARRVRFAEDTAAPRTAGEFIELPELEYELFLMDLKGGRITELIVPTAFNAELNLSSNADEAVVETAREKRFKEQDWDALKGHPVYPLVYEYRDIFPASTPIGLPSYKGVEHEIDLEPGTKYCVTRQWPLPREQVEFIDEFFAKKKAAGLVRESNSQMCVARRATPVSPMPQSRRWRPLHNKPKTCTRGLPGHDGLEWVVGAARFVRRVCSRVVERHKDPR